MSHSASLYAKARQLIPYEVNSPVRVFNGVGGTPLFVASGDGACITDTNGNSYIDYIGSWEPMVRGLNHPTVCHRLYCPPYSALLVSAHPLKLK